MAIEKPALIVVDMLNDFVTGALGCDNALSIVQPSAELIDAARAKGIPVIFANDAHRKGIDRELELWGDHAIAGTLGAQVIDELKAGSSEVDYIIPKRRYSGFFQTDLDITLTELGVKTIIIMGLHAHMCCRHTAADGYCLGYDVVAAKDCLASFTTEQFEGGLAYLKECYGAPALTNEEIIAQW